MLLYYSFISLHQEGKEVSSNPNKSSKLKEDSNSIFFHMLEFAELIMSYIN